MEALFAFALVLGLGTMPMWLDALYSHSAPPPATPTAKRHSEPDADTLARFLIGDDWDGTLTGYTPITADIITTVTIDTDRLHVEDERHQ